MPVTTQKKTMTYAEWEAKGLELFGPDQMSWRFVCPCCRHIQSIQECKDAGGPDSALAFSCIGRWSGTSVRRSGKGPARATMPAADCFSSIRWP